MKNGINLISQEGKERVKLLKIKEKLKKIFIILISCFVIIVLFSFGSLFLLNQKYNNNTKKIDNLQNSIRALNKTESYLITILNRANQIDKILVNRKSLYSPLSKFNELQGPGYEFSSMEIVLGGESKLAISCIDSQSLNNFYEKVETLKENKSFRSILYDGVSKQLKGGYLVDLLLIE